MSCRPFSLALLTLLIPVVSARSENDLRISEALWRGMDYMIRSASEPDNFEQYASDYLFFFADISRVDDPWIQQQARLHGQRLGRVYLEELFGLDSADAVVDAASALWALEFLGMDVQAPLVLLRNAAGSFGRSDYLGFTSYPEGPNLDEMIDLLIGFHFTDRVGVPIGVSYAEALLHVPSVSYSLDAKPGDDRYVDQNNLVTHLVYTLSDYSSYHLSSRLLPREYEYIREQIPAATMWADPETLAEFVDSLKVMGFDRGDPDVRAGMEILLSIQKPDGRWEPEEPEDEYDRYHATWCAMDALRSYRLGEDRGISDPLVLELLETWAGQYSSGKQMQPNLPVRKSSSNN